MINLTPKYTIPSAEMELALQPGVMPMGYSVGGISAFNNSFKRGYGDRIFGTDDRGSWWGAADYDDAPIKISMSGVITLSLGDGAVTIDANGIVQWVDDVPVGLWGFQENGF